MTAGYAASIDQGTTGTRFMVFSKDGQVVLREYAEHRQIYPQPGWVEHDAAEIWSRTKQVVESGLARHGVSSPGIVALGITNQRETTVVWDPSTGLPLHNALVWQDTRTRDFCEQLIAQGAQEMIRSRTGLPISTYFSAPKIRWLLDNLPGLREKAHRGQALFGSIDTWLIWNLTGGPRGGVHVTDVTNGSRTMLMDLRSLDWDHDLLELFQIPREMLPQIRPSSEVYGFTSKKGPLGTCLPIGGDLGDQQSALVGQACFSPGEAKNTYGTGSFLLLNTGPHPVESSSGLVTTVAYATRSGEATYALEGSVAITGAAVQWLRDNLGIIESAGDTEEIAQSVEDAGGIYFVPAFSGLFAPYWDMTARGAIVGLTRYVTRAHLVQATLESICYQSKDVLVAMEADSHISLRALKVDGGATVNNYLMQLQADILGVNTVRPRVGETTALGSAYMAGLATGLWRDLDELRANWAVDRIFEPRWDAQRRAAQYRGWQRAVARARGWIEEN
jgi:glycerol kinase